jgi:uncharacterized membrane protein HdeD (DUF308 family)
MEVCMSNASFFDSARDRFRSGLTELGAKWGWYFALGVFLVVLGVIAAGMAVTTTLLSVMALGGILVIAGAGLVIMSFLTGRWSGFLLSLAAGILSIIAGIDLLSFPLAGAVSITVILATIFLVAGIFRSIGAISMRFPNWGWALFSGVVTAVLGIALMRNWQATSLLFLGFAIGIELILHGISWMTFAAGLRRLAGELGGREAERRAA